MIAVIVPAHNEENHINACLASVGAATRCPYLQGEQTIVIVVLDDCDDGTHDAAKNMGATTISLAARNVGAARDLGAQLALAAGARWLAFTDADTEVSPDWISAQLALLSDAVCGTVVVNDWGTYGVAMRQHHADTYIDADGHAHIHGANLGVSAKAYERAGGFQFLDSSEDVALVNTLQATGAIIAWSAAPRVVTSSRRNYKAPGGFGETLARFETQSLGRLLKQANA